MPTTNLTIAALFQAAQASDGAVVRWGERVDFSGPGVYVITTTPDPGDAEGPAEPQISNDAINELLDKRDTLAVDGAPATLKTLRNRLHSMWIPGSTVLYIGLAGTSLRERTRQYYRTPIGARRPHAGGWPIKMLANLPELWVHYASHDDPDHAERVMVDDFMVWSRGVIGPDFCDPSTPLPFANLTVPGGRRQQHGISGARAARIDAVAPDRPRPQPSAAGDARSGSAPTGVQSGSGRSQRVTANDIKAGQIRVPGDTKRLFPSSRSDVRVVLRGRTLDGKWDPKNGPDQPRSGVLRFGRSALIDLVTEDETLWIRVVDEQYVIGDTSRQ